MLDPYRILLLEKRTRVLPRRRLIRPCLSRLPYTALGFDSWQLKTALRNTINGPPFAAGGEWFLLRPTDVRFGVRTTKRPTQAIIGSNSEGIEKVGCIAKNCFSKPGTKIMLLNKGFWTGFRREERRRLSLSPTCLLFEAFEILFRHACACRKNLFLFCGTGCFRGTKWRYPGSTLIMKKLVSRWRVDRLLLRLVVDQFIVLHAPILFGFIDRRPTVPYFALDTWDRPHRRSGSLLVPFHQELRLQLVHPLPTQSS